MNARIVAILIACQACCLPVAHGGTNSWPHVRGPRCDGHAPYAQSNSQWHISETNVLWRAQLGDGYSGMVVANGCVYTQDQDLGGQFVVCLDLRSGKELWRTRYEWPWELDGDWPGPYASPTYADGKIFFAGCFGLVGCLDADTGKLIWSVDLVNELGLRIPGFGYTTTPLIYNGKVFVTAAEQEGSVLALNAENGVLIWRKGSGPAGYCSCVLIHVNGQPQIVAVPENIAIGLDPETGKELWNQPLVTSGYDPHASWPLYQEPYLFYSLPFRNGSQVCKLTQSSDTTNAAPVWKSNIMSIDILSGVIKGGFVYAFDLHDAQTRPYGKSEGILKCIELVSGKERWASDEPGHTSVMSCGDKLVMLNETGTLVVAEASPSGYQELTRFSLFPGGQCWTAPAVHEDLLIARCQKNIVCISMAVDAAKPTDPQLQLQKERNSASEWFERYYSRAFWAPSLTDQLLWYVYCVAGVFLPAWILAAASGARRRLRNAIFYGAPMILSLVGVWIFTWLLGRLIFTWPVIIFQTLFLLIMCRAWAVRKPSFFRGVIARLALAGFVLVVAVYWIRCQQLFVVSGWGYLVGLIPVVLVMFPAVGPALRNESLARRCLAHLFSFSFYFWCSAIFTLWKTGG